MIIVLIPTAFFTAFAIIAYISGDVVSAKMAGEMALVWLVVVAGMWVIAEKDGE